MQLLAILAVLAVVNAKPLPAPQGVTAMISPKAPAPSGCMPSMSGSFGIAVANVTGGGSMGASQKGDGQPQATGKVSQISDGQVQATPKPVNQISDGQVQATPKPVNQISDGQVQGPKTMKPVNQIGDGQVQGPKTMGPVKQIGDGQVQATKAPAVSQIGDGQVQATKAPAVSQISDGQVQQKPTPKPAVSQISDGQVQKPTPKPAASQISDGQVQATGVSQIGDGQTQATGTPQSMTNMVACKSDGTLSLTLAGGVLKDGQGRIGYIAANYQFQFDAPPQTGAIYTSGWSLCGNGSLALGGSTTFYQCLSGDFYNLYNENWAPQCNPVTLDVLGFVDCP